MPTDISQIPTQLEEQLAFTCAYEKDRIPERDPEADTLFEHANWRYKKNRLREDPKVYAEVERLYRIATAWGHDKAANNLAYMMMRRYIRRPDRVTKPVDIAEDLINRGIPRGYYLMGVLLDKGYGVKRDGKASLQYFRKAADLGEPEAQWFIGEKLENLSIRHPIPYKVGLEMQHCAADQGHAEAAISTALGLMGKEQYSEALKYFQIAAKAGNASGASWLYRGFDGPTDKMYYMAQAKDEERVTRYKAIWKALDGYYYLPAKVDEIDEICPLPPAKLPPWDGKLKWVEQWESNEAPPLPSEERIAEMALAKNLNPETGLPVKIDLPAARLLDPETGKSLQLKKETILLLRRMRDK